MAKSKPALRLETFEQDDKLRLCSLAAQGLWLRLVFVMQRNEDRYGYMPVTDSARVARLVGHRPPEVAVLLDELVDNGVLARDSDGAISCPRMLKDHAAWIASREYGLKGGNPNVKKTPFQTLVKESQTAPTAPAAPQAPEGPKQPSMFSEPEKPKTASQLLWSDGIEVLAEITGRDLKIRTQATAVGNLMGKIVKSAGDLPHDIILDIIRQGKNQQAGTQLRWITGAITNRSKLRLVHSNDPNDDYGIQGWCAANGLEAVTDEEERKLGKWVAHGRFFDQLAKRVGEAAQLRRAWRIDWRPLLTWIENGHDPNRIVSEIQKRTEWDGYEPSEDLGRFNKSFPDKNADQRTLAKAL